MTSPCEHGKVTDQPGYRDSFVTLHVWVDTPRSPLCCRRFAPDLDATSRDTAAGSEAIEELAIDSVRRLEELLRR